MKLSAKWSTVSFLTLMTVGAGSFVYAGCTVTSGDIDDDTGGTGTPRPDGGSATDSGGGEDASAPADAGPACTPLEQQRQLIDDACQACLEQNCCAELQGCYNLDLPAGDPTCDDYADELAKNNCERDPNVDAGTDECNAIRNAVDPAIPPAFNAIANCGAANTTCAAACGL